MGLLSIILSIIIAILVFLLLKKERVLGIQTETENNNKEVKIIESKDYRKNINKLLDYFPEGVLIID